MSENRFLNFICLEGLILTILGLCVLILPKLTALTFGAMLSAAFITYGLYKIIISFVNRSYTPNIVWNIFSGSFILTIGILLLLVPRISILWLMALIGVFFLLESISSTAFMVKLRSIFNYSGCKGFAAFIMFLVGLIIILGLPIMSFWVVAILCGVALLVKGLSKITLSLANRNNYNI